MLFTPKWERWVLKYILNVEECKPVSEAMDLFWKTDHGDKYFMKKTTFFLKLLFKKENIEFSETYSRWYKRFFKHIQHSEPMVLDI